MNLTIKTRLIALALLGVLLMAIMGAVGYIGMQNVNHAMSDIVKTSAILRNHMTADMMHDALNSDVRGALLVGQGGTTNIAIIQADFKEHASIFTSSLQKNQQLAENEQIRNALQKTMPALQAYIAAADKIIYLTNTDRQAALNNLPGFKTAFDSLADEMESLTQLIENETALMEKSGNEAVVSAKNILLIFIISGVVLLAFSSLLIVKNITESLSRLIEASDKVASGDLTIPIRKNHNDEIGQLASAMEKMRDKLKDLISQIISTTGQLSSASEEISSITAQASQRVKNQQEETAHVATAMNEMTSTVHDVAANINLTAESAAQAHNETKTGNQVMNQAVEQIQVLANQIGDASEIINRLETNSHNISSVLGVIQSIAEQTNLLALNAAIEAARAGEQGRGFAVVADEVRTLASRTQKSTEEINHMIEELQSGSKASVDAMERSRTQADLAVNQAKLAGDSLTSISAAVIQISDMSTQIASAAEQQTSVSEEINRNIVRINDLTSETAEGTHQTSIATHELARMASELQQMVRQFRV